VEAEREALRQSNGRRRWVTLILVVVIALCFLPQVGSGAELHRAAVVVRHGNGGVTYALVAFPEASINAVELLKRANLDAVTVEFGGLGEAACMIEKEGCPPSVCQKKVCQTGAAESPFWHFYQLDASGTWQFAALGASSVKVHNGDVTGWSWTGKDPNLPAESFAALEKAAPKPEAGANAVVWRSGPLPPSETSRQSRFAYLGAAAVLVVALGAAAFVVIRQRRAAPDRGFDDG
jgi:hypothetical protein